MLSSLSLGSPARAQGEPEPPGYREIVREALSEYQAKNFPEARALFEEAHRLYPNARTLRGLGMTSFELRQYVESVDFLEQALASTVKPLEGPLRAETERLLSRARRFVGKLSLSVEPATTEVLLDGHHVDYKAGVPLLLEMGDHTLTFQAPGYVPETRSLTVRGRESETWTVTLAPVPLPEPVAAAPAPGPVVQETVDRAERVDHGERPSKPPLYKNPWLWTAVGVVVVGAAVAASVLATRAPPGVKPVTITSNTPQNGGVFTALGSRP
ncbi:MAG TPA: tetratricopeptide repeat protein [Polyangiaceae bacterium]|nr:tetratricopeptide repeat protein [Polyangiaceae bacterium]